MRSLTRRGFSITEIFFIMIIIGILSLVLDSDVQVNTSTFDDQSQSVQQGDTTTWE